MSNTRRLSRLGRAARATGKWIGAIAFVLIAAAFVYEHVAAWRDNRVLMRIGKSVDVGGRTLNIHCMGDGTPTVIFESGHTSPGYVWMPSQRETAKITRACWYDRAGLGWSDPGPDPNWGDSAVRDLHALLAAAHIPPPYVMVGASLGGYFVRLYHSAYPGEVSGLVLVDAAHEDAGTIAGMPSRRPPNVPRPVVRRIAVVLGHLGAMRAFARQPGPQPRGWSAEEWDALARLRRRRNAFLTDFQEGPERETVKFVRASGGLEHLPLIVLTQGKRPVDPDPIETAKFVEVQSQWIALQAQLARRSVRGRQIVVTESGHGIAEEAPDAVVNAIRELLTEIRAPKT